MRAPTINQGGASKEQLDFQAQVSSRGSAGPWKARRAPLRGSFSAPERAAEMAESKANGWPRADSANRSDRTPAVEPETRVRRARSPHTIPPRKNTPLPTTGKRPGARLEPAGASSCLSSPNVPPGEATSSGREGRDIRGCAARGGRGVFFVEGNRIAANAAVEIA